MGQYERHVFVCTHGKTCPGQGSEAVHAELKRRVKDAGLKQRVRINHAGCMNQCGHGPMVVVYPQDVWYAHVDSRGAQRILVEHLVGGTPVEEPRVAGAAIVYRLFDVGYEIHLDRALDLLAASAPERVRPVRGEAQAIQIPNPPITVILGTEEIVIGSRQL